MAENNRVAQVVSGRIFSSSFPLLAAQASTFRKIVLWLFPLGFPFLSVAEIVEKNMVQLLKMCSTNLVLLHKMKVDLVLRLHIFRIIHIILFHKFSDKKQLSTLISTSIFHSNFQEFYELNFQRENWSKCMKKLSFPNWHTRRIFVPYTCLLRSIQK